MLWTLYPLPLDVNVSTRRSRGSPTRTNGVQSDEAVVQRGPGRVALGRKPAGFRLPNLDSAGFRLPNLTRYFLGRFFGVFFSRERLERRLLHADLEVGPQHFDFLLFLFADLLFFFLFLFELVAQHSFARIRAHPTFGCRRRAEGRPIAHGGRAMRLT